MSYEQMKASAARRQAAKFDPDSYGFEGATVEHLRGALDKGGDRIIVKLGQRADGSPEAWIMVKAKDQVLYAGNVSYTCPPRPPEWCDE